MFQFRRFPTRAYLIQRALTGSSPAGLPHSEIHGSMPICGSPWLIAACHVLHRLLMPRHPPCALVRLTLRRPVRSDYRQLQSSCPRIMQAPLYRSCFVKLQIHPPKRITSTNCFANFFCRFAFFSFSIYSVLKVQSRFLLKPDRSL